MARAQGDHASGLGSKARGANGAVALKPPSGPPRGNSDASSRSCDRVCHRSDTAAGCRRKLCPGSPGEVWTESVRLHRRRRTGRGRTLGLPGARPRHGAAGGRRVDAETTADAVVTVACAGPCSKRRTNGGQDLRETMTSCSRKVAMEARSKNGPMISRPRLSASTPANPGTSESPRPAAAT
jgi:hypothetical protein